MLSRAEPARAAAEQPPRRSIRRGPGASLHLVAHPAAPDPTNSAAIRRWLRGLSGPTAIDLFCGAGGLSLGLRNAGFSVVVGADVDPTSVETHTANLGGLGYLGDLGNPDLFLTQLREWGIRRVDLVAGGVPCQPFSRAGRSKIRSLVRAGVRSEHDERADLWESFVAIVRSLRPRAVLLENVPDLAVWNEGAVLLGFCEALRELGYHADAVVLNAFDYGVPQHRARLFVIATRPGVRFQWPEPRAPRPSIRDAIGDLPVLVPELQRERIPYSGPRSLLQQLLRSGVADEDRGWIHDHMTRPVRDDDAEAFALLAEGQTYADLPDRLQRYRADIFPDKYNRLEWDGLSRSITAHLAKDGYWYIHPAQNRTLSVREAARLQTFPDWFRFAGRPSGRYRQIGNAVPPLMAEAIGHELRRALTEKARRGRPLGSGRSFRDLLLEWHSTAGRAFPWRQGVDPWRVLMAEVCLRRTRADQVVPVFGALSRIAPTPEAMVARPSDVLEAMRSLGLEWRARNMLAIAEAVVERHGGRVPDSEEALLSLPGVGQYVARAVLAFGFGRRAVIIDTNTARIVSRVRGRGAGRRWQLRLDLYRLAGGPGPDANFSYALLDLGALVCRPQNPACPTCPVRRNCATYAESLSGATV